MSKIANQNNAIYRANQKNPGSQIEANKAAPPYFKVDISKNTNFSNKNASNVYNFREFKEDRNTLKNRLDLKVAHPESFTTKCYDPPNE